MSAHTIREANAADSLLNSITKKGERMPNLRPKSERAPRELCWFVGSSVARAALA
jgi:hypothetical protein